MKCYLTVLLSSLVLLTVADTCVDKFCPEGTYCEERSLPCNRGKCPVILFCLPKSENGCARTTCGSGKVCVERVVPCIGKMCKKQATCEQPGTCAATVCDPSEKCEMKNGRATCVKNIPPTRGIIGKALLEPTQFEKNRQ